MPRLSRRAAVAGLGAASLLPLLADPARLAVAAGVGLNAHATRAGLIFGAATTAESQRDPDHQALYRREVGLITTDLDLKFWSLRPDPDTWAFEPADALIGWARRSGLLVRGHTLIWNEDLPDWLKRCSAREVARIFDAHIDRVVSRYAGRIHVWDVVNEPLWPDHGMPGGLRKGVWYNALGPDYIPRALKRVRAIDPHARLCINEAGCEVDDQWSRDKRPCMARLIDDLHQRGVPLDALGLESHLPSKTPLDNSRTVDFMHSLAVYGLDLHITELDVDDSAWPDDVATRDARVAALTGAYLDAVLSVPAVKIVTTWELRDPDSWYVHAALDKDPAATPLPRPLPFDGENRRKPMAVAIARSFERRTVL